MMAAVLPADEGHVFLVMRLDHMDEFPFASVKVLGAFRTMASAEVAESRERRRLSPVDDCGVWIKSVELED